MDLVNGDDSRGRYSLIAAILLLAVLVGVAWVLIARAAPAPVPGVAEISRAAAGARSAVVQRQVRALKAHGMALNKHVGERGCGEPFLSAVGRRYDVGVKNRFGPEAVCIYPYADRDSARRDTSEVPPDADTGMTDWAMDTHYFRCGDAVAVYFGYARRNREILTTVCGRAVATGRKRF